mmetsp:Transcript_115119/g.298492  ORF Transcript_115119/g.298492 Transcript_115119/m.298492 type:complete len:301 (-) Transcript_115119:7-909(-)
MVSSNFGIAEDAPPQGFLVRVKRPRDVEPLPELLVEASHFGKRRRVGVASAALRLVDSVSAGQWTFHEGLPPDLSKAASAVSAASSGASAVERHRPREVRKRAPVLQEAARRVVAGSSGEAVQLVDVEVTAAAVTAPAPKPVLSGFLIDGQPLVATPCPVAAPAAAGAAEAPSEEDGDYVWDVYAASDFSLGAGVDGSSALLRLSAPLTAEDDDDDDDLSELEDFGDIDDDSSDDAGSSCGGGGGAGGNAGSAAQSCIASKGFRGLGSWGGGESSSDEDEAWLQDPVPRRQGGHWVNELD